MPAQRFDVSNEMLRRVINDFGVRGGTARTALVEQNHAVVLWIMKAPHARHIASTRPAVQQHHRPAGWMSALLVVHAMPGIQLQAAGVEGLGGGIQGGHGTLWFPRSGSARWCCALRCQALNTLSHGQQGFVTFGCAQQRQPQRRAVL